MDRSLRFLKGNCNHSSCLPFISLADIASEIFKQATYQDLLQDALKVISIGTVCYLTFPPEIVRS